MNGSEIFHITLFCVSIHIHSTVHFNDIKQLSLKLGDNIIFWCFQKRSSRKLQAFIMIPLIQKDLAVFRESAWNTHRIRAQKDTILPHSIPNHIYSFPEQYGLEECGMFRTPNNLNAQWSLYSMFFWRCYPNVDGNTSTKLA